MDRPMSQELKNELAKEMYEKIFERQNDLRGEY